MKKFLTVTILMILLALLFLPKLYAFTIIDFENVPENYWYFGGNNELSDYYPMVTFSGNVTILEGNVYGFNNSYEEHSGYAVAASQTDYIIRADFKYPTNRVEVWATSIREIDMIAFDILGNRIDGCDDNIVGGNLGETDLMSIMCPDFNISYVQIEGHNSEPGQYIIDDFGYQENIPAPVPEPSTILLLGIGLLGLVGIKSRKKKS